MFANLRESAGTTSAEFPGETVGAVIAAAVGSFGAEFERGLQSARIWLNGNPAGTESQVADDDEIALIPPVSGGAIASGAEKDWTRTGLVAALIAAVVVGNFISTGVFAFVAVGAALAWLWDVRDAMRMRGSRIEVVPVMAAAAAGGNGAYGWGTEGLAGGLVVGLMVVLTWSVLDRRSRSTEAVGNAALLAAVASVGTGGLVLSHVRNQDEVTLFLALAVATAVAGWAAGRYAPLSSGLDPNVAGLLTALAGGAVAAFTTDVVSVPVAVLAALAVGTGFIAGRTLGSLTRTGFVVHTTRAPGLLTMFDGPLLAAGLFWAVVAVFS